MMCDYVDIRLEGTTDASGDLTVNASRSVIGELVAVEWNDGDFADGVDAVISLQNRASGVAKTVLTLTNANDDAWYYPRTPSQDNAGADVTYDGTNEIYEPFFVTGTPRLVVSSGGNAKSGGCTLYIRK